MSERTTSDLTAAYNEGILQGRWRARAEKHVNYVLGYAMAGASAVVALPVALLSPRVQNDLWNIFWLWPFVCLVIAITGLTLYLFGFFVDTITGHRLEEWVNKKYIHAVDKQTAVLAEKMPTLFHVGISVEDEILISLNTVDGEIVRSQTFKHEDETLALETVVDWKEDIVTATDIVHQRALEELSINIQQHLCTPDSEQLQLAAAIAEEEALQRQVAAAQIKERLESVI